MDELITVMGCDGCGALIPARNVICTYCGYDNTLIESEKYLSMPYSELTNQINVAFYKLEGFMNGPVLDYKYFGFIEAFISLFIKTRKPENYTSKNVIRISKYWDLVDKLRVDFDKSNFSNRVAWQNEEFEKDSRELEYVNWNMSHEFLSFTSAEDKIKFNQEVSISRIISQIEDHEPDGTEKKGGLNLRTQFKKDHEYDIAISKLILGKAVRKVGEELILTPLRRKNATYEAVTIFEALSELGYLVKKERSPGEIGMILSNTFKDWNLSTRVISDLKTREKLDDYKAILS